MNGQQKQMPAPREPMNNGLVQGIGFSPDQPESRWQIITLAVGGFDSNFSYVIHDPVSGDTAIVDPCGDGKEIIQTLRQFPSFNPAYLLVTHAHHDHISALRTIRDYFSAPLAALSADLNADIVPVHG